MWERWSGVGIGLGRGERCGRGVSGVGRGEGGVGEVEWGGEG